MPNQYSLAKQKITAFTLALLTSLTGFAGKKAVSADNIFFVYTPIIVSLRIDSLRQFAEDGTVNQNLGTYLGLAGVNEEEKAKFREALITPVKVDPVLVSRILNTEEAERLLNYFGSVIEVQGGSNGKYLLRGALVQAAMEEDGISLLNVLDKLAVDVQIDIAKILKYSSQVELIVKGSYLFNEEVANLETLQSQKGEKIDYDRLPDIRQQGNIPVAQETLNLYDESRDRRFYVELYYPQQINTDRLPVIMLSHGLSSRPEDFAKRAIHLASYGFVVAMPQHPGSDILQTEDFLAGYSRQIFRTNEFIDRPLDISYTLDELEKLNQRQFQGKLDLNNVGIFGHSFGGYTALSLAGATIDFERLERNCNLDIGYLNTALLLQCRALNLEKKEYNFRDSRIQAVYVINPVNAAILGATTLSKIRIPTFIGAGSYDPATPFIFEQAQTYPFITGKESEMDTYLQLQEGQAHIDFSELDAGLSEIFDTATNLTLPSPTLLDDYTNSFMLAFFQTYVGENPDYNIYLQPAYAKYLSHEQEFKTNLITQESAPKLKESFLKFVEDNSNLIFD